MAMGVALAAAFAGALAPIKRSGEEPSKRKKRLSARIASFLEGQEGLSKRIPGRVFRGGHGTWADFFSFPGCYFGLGRGHVFDGRTVCFQKGVSAEKWHFHWHFCIG